MDLPPQPPQVVVTARVACAGDTVTWIEVRRHAPSSRTAPERALAATSEVVGIERPRTRDAVILAYVRLKPGQPCTEETRSESERLLRAQRFIASAAVTAVPDGVQRVRIRVDVVEELPWVGGLQLASGSVQRLQLGTRNLDGRGTTLVASGESGGAYRPGAGLVVGQHALFGRPAYGTLEVRRRPLGGLLLVSVAEPFLTDLQRQALHSSFRQETAYPVLVRPGGDDAAVRVRRSAYDVGLVRRIGAPGRDRIVGLAGAMFIGSDVRTAGQVVILSDSGLVSSADTVLAGLYSNYGAGRVAGLGGVRAIAFETVQRFDALRAAQDIGTGFQATLLAGPSLWNSGDRGDLLVVGDLYAAAGDARSLAAVRLRAESRRGFGDTEWDAFVGSARFSWHRITSERRTRTVSLSLASLSRMVFPAQLTLRDPDGGLVGFPGSHGAGGQRAVLRIEERSLVPWLPARADIALGAFADAGRLWGGDVPYGATTPVRSSVGIALLGAFPAGGKRLYRLDLAVPVNPEPGRAGLVLRFSSADRTGFVWSEPLDVTRARSGTGAGPLLRW